MLLQTIKIFILFAAIAVADHKFIFIDKDHSLKLYMHAPADIRV
jgi:hypothetical protein